MSSDPLKHRLSLWLRGERAMGLPSVPVAGFGESLHVDTPTRDSAEVERGDGVGSQRPPLLAAPRAAVAPVRAASSTPIPPATAIALKENQTGSASPPAPGARPKSLPLWSEPLTSVPMARDEKIAALFELNERQVKGCTLCRLHTTRTQTVFGEGDPDARIFFVGEGPGETEDRTGRPFVGAAGQFLDKMIRGMGFTREQLFIANIVKCRPPQNRAPAADETEACTPYLVRQLEIVRPEVIVTLGLPATQYMLQSKLSMSRMRGTWQQWRGIPLMPTFHPAYILRAYTDQNRAMVWDDLKKVLAALGLSVPKRSGKQE